MAALLVESRAKANFVGIGGPQKAGTSLRLAHARVSAGGPAVAVAYYPVRLSEPELRSMTTARAWMRRVVAL